MGSLSITHDRQLPGAPVPGGYNYQTGFGLFPGFEFVGRLATNDLHCNMFARGACPPGTIRDFSASMKWQLPLPWDEKRWPSLAIGATDLGGAATYFRSYYAVATQQWRDWRFSVGKAEGQVPSAPLHGAFGSIQYSPVSWFSLSAEQIDKDRWLSAKFQPTISSANFAIKPYLYFTRSLGEPSLTDRQWLGFGFSLPLGRGEWGSPSYDRVDSEAVRTVKQIEKGELAKALKERGFYRFRLGEERDLIVLRVENTNYHWNLVDAVGNALGVLVEAYGDSNQAFRLEVTQRDIVVTMLEGSLVCAKQLLSEGSFCNSEDSLRFMSQREFAITDVKWNERSQFALRPELVISPALITAIGTEFGALDIATALNFNWIFPLWTGAIYDWNRITPVNGLASEDFEKGKPFYNSRFLSSTNRKMFHQFVPVHAISSVFKGSVGTVYSYWHGWQVESSTIMSGGQHRLGLSSGRFSYEMGANSMKPREPRLISWRYAPREASFFNAELQAGRFWNGDQGYALTQRFWYGDTSLALYVRRSRMSENEPLVSFAGFQMQVPLTFRRQAGFELFGLRGTNMWTYSVESKILEKDNKITPGYGVVPRIGDGLSQWLNRDRIGTEYLNQQMPRLRESYWAHLKD